MIKKRTIYIDIVYCMSGVIVFTSISKDNIANRLNIRPNTCKTTYNQFISICTERA